MSLFRRELLQLLGASTFPNPQGEKIDITANTRNPSSKRPGTIQNWKSHVISTDTTKNGHFSLQRLHFLDASFEKIGNPSFGIRDSIYGADSGCWRYTFAVSGSTVAHENRDKGALTEKAIEQLNGTFGARGINPSAKIGSKIAIEPSENTDLSNITIAPRHGADSFQVFSTPTPGNGLDQYLNSTYPNLEVGFDSLDQYLTHVITMACEYLDQRADYVASSLPLEPEELQLSREDVYEALARLQDKNQDVQAATGATLAAASIAITILTLGSASVFYIAAGVLVGIASGVLGLLTETQPSFGTKYYDGIQMKYPPDSGGPMTQHRVLFDVYVPEGKPATINVSSQNYGPGLTVNSNTVEGKWRIHINRNSPEETSSPVPNLAYGKDTTGPDLSNGPISPKVTVTTPPTFTYSTIRDDTDALRGNESKVRPMYRPLPGFVFKMPFYQLPSIENNGNRPAIQVTAANSLLTDRRTAQFEWIHKRVGGSHPENTRKAFIDPDIGPSDFNNDLDGTGKTFEVTPDAEPGVYLIGLRARDGTGNEKHAIATQPYEATIEPWAPSPDPSAKFDITETDGRYRFESNHTISESHLLGPTPLNWFWELEDSDSIRAQYAFSPFGTGESAEKRFDTPGTYRIHHVVTDRRGRWYIEQDTIEVS